VAMTFAVQKSIITKIMTEKRRTKRMHRLLRMVLSLAIKISPEASDWSTEALDRSLSLWLISVLTVALR